MVSRSCRLLYVLDHRVADKERIFDCPLFREPNGQTQQRVDGRAVGRFRAEDAYLVKLSDDACRRLAVASPHQGKFDL